MAKEPNELLSGIDYNKPPQTEWMDTPVEFKRATIVMLEGKKTLNISAFRMAGNGRHPMMTGNLLITGKRYSWKGWKICSRSSALSGSIWISV